MKAAPGGAELREAALAHLARFAATETGLIRVLDRRILRWARQAAGEGVDPDQIRQGQEQARRDVRTVVTDMVRIGVVDDAVFAESRARALARGGRSRRAIGAHLANRGIDPEQIAEAIRGAQSEALDDAAQAELAAALLQARKRRIGPFSPPSGDEAPGEDSPGDGDLPRRQRALAALARAGFSHDVASSALDTDLEAAEALIARLRSS